MSTYDLGPRPHVYDEWNSGLSIPITQGERSPAFALYIARDYYPVLRQWPIPNKTPEVTFQVTPTLINCDHRLPQALHPAGLNVALADGSVRTLSPSVSNTTFWYAVTPAEGEVLGNDW